MNNQIKFSKYFKKSMKKTIKKVEVESKVECVHIYVHFHFLFIPEWFPLYCKNRSEVSEFPKVKHKLSELFACTVSDGSNMLKWQSFFLLFFSKFPLTVHFLIVSKLCSRLIMEESGSSQIEFYNWAFILPENRFCWEGVWLQDKHMLRRRHTFQDPLRLFSIRSDSQVSRWKMIRVIMIMIAMLEVLEWQFLFFCCIKNTHVRQCKCIPGFL